MESTLTWLVFFPFLGAAVLGLVAFVDIGALKKWAGPFASFIVFLSFIQATRLAAAHIGLDSTPLVAQLGSWMESGTLSLRWALRFDTLSGILTLLVTGVGLMIHLYSIGYMAHDAGRVRYFAFLNLFCGFMLLLLTASSLPMMFIGWEGVGLCSYLLIGFWYGDRANALAGKKAFVVNRIGDAGFLLGMFMIFQNFGTLDIQTLSQHTLLKSFMGTPALELTALLLFIGCVGKSAQFPLYIWLPDAMAGPTPVSALIHAATMVTAGVYLIARMSFLYAGAPLTSEVIAGVGAFTAFFAATIAVAQTDIKKVLAYSTISQLGFMVLAMGVGAYDTGIFHLVTHAFFKALLFLAAGSVIHSLHGEQNILKMGGLKTYLVSTTLVFICGYFAIIGFPGSSGWFSKDAILYETWLSGHFLLFCIGVATALLTAMYMTRLFYLVFLGVPRASARDLQEIHESPVSMIAPMWILAALSIFGGAFGVTKSLEGVLAKPLHKPHELPLTEGEFTWILTLVVFLVVAATFKFYMKYAGRELKSPSALRLQALLTRQYGLNDFAMWIGGPITRLTARSLRLVDIYIIDRFLETVTSFVQGMSSAVARLQSGFVQVYALAMGLGSILVVWLLLRGGK